MTTLAPPALGALLLAAAALTAAGRARADTSIPDAIELRVGVAGGGARS